MTRPVQGQARGSYKLILAIGLTLVIVAAAVLGTLIANGGTEPTAGGAQSPGRLHVADLMTKAGCVGTVTGTQQFSYETGQCELAGAHVIIAVFESGELRDRWLTSARQFMETFVAGVGWAAAMDKPTAAPLLAVALEGGVV